MLNPYQPETLRWHLFNDLINPDDAAESREDTPRPQVTLLEAIYAVQEKIDDAAPSLPPIRKRQP